MSEARAACEGQWALFDSTVISEHIKARAICARCPILDACRDNLTRTRQLARYKTISGTWAGDLLGADAIALNHRKAHPREHGSERGYQQHRYRREIACDDCRAAHRKHEADRLVAREQPDYQRLATNTRRAS